eukprot:SAG11_NODE_16448_length_547_cov_0.743304_1_plen_154_part_00
MQHNIKYFILFHIFTHIFTDCSNEFEFAKQFFLLLFSRSICRKNPFQISANAPGDLQIGSLPWHENRTNPRLHCGYRVTRRPPGWWDVGSHGTYFPCSNGDCKQCNRNTTGSRTVDRLFRWLVAWLMSKSVAWTSTLIKRFHLQAFQSMWCFI